MPQNQSALIAAALGELGAIASGQTPASEDVSAVTPRVAPVLADLKARRVFGAIDANAIPDAIFPDLVRLLAEHVASLFGRSANPDAIALAEERIRFAGRLLPESQTPFVRSVLEQIEALGGSRFADGDFVSRQIPSILGELGRRGVIVVADESDIPEEAAPDLARYAAASLATPLKADVMAFSEERLRMLNRPSGPLPCVRATYF